MKKQTKGILAFGFLGGLMLTSGVLIAIPGYDEQVDYAAMNDPAVTITGTPADNYPDEQRTQFCSSDKIAKSTLPAHIPANEHNLYSIRICKQHDFDVVQCVPEQDSDPSQ